MTKKDDKNYKHCLEELSKIWLPKTKETRPFDPRLQGSKLDDVKKCRTFLSADSTDQKLTWESVKEETDDLREINAARSKEIPGQNLILGTVRNVSDGLSKECVTYSKEIPCQTLTWGTAEDETDDLRKGGATWGNLGQDLAEDEMREACGVFGCVLAKETLSESVNAAQVIYLGLVALQHRGQESAGIVTSEGRGTKSFHYYKGEGLVASIFNDDKLAKLQGTLGIGHSRYSTAGGRDPCNTQPFVVHTRHGPLAIAHNGELINAVALRKTVLDRGVGLSTCSDSELITQMLSLTPPKGEKDGPDWGARIRHLMEATPTAYSLALLHEDKIYGVRDPFGNRPLCIGRLMPLDARRGTDSPKPLGWVLSSESCAFQSVGATLIREVYPGEIVELGPHGVRSLDLVPRPKPPLIEATGGSDHADLPNIREAPPPAFCIFEYVYFARPDSIYEGQQVYSVRKRCGRQLAIEAPVDADIISTVPESATPAAVGFAQQSGLPYVEVLCKNRYVGRSFIQPDTRSRQLAVAKKFGALSENLVGRSVVLVDDSIVRGTTVGPIIKLLRQAGAREVHIRIASPPIHHPCYMGINIPTRGELIANKKPLEELAGFIGADSLAYLSIEGLVKAVTEGLTTRNGTQSGHCTACLDGKYPVHLEW